MAISYESRCTDKACKPPGGTLMFYIYIGLADFCGQNFEIQYFFGFSEKSLFFGKVSFYGYFLGSAN